MNFHNKTTFDLSILRVALPSLVAILFCCCDSSDDSNAVQLEYDLEGGNNIQLVFSNNQSLFEHVPTVVAKSNQANSAVQKIMSIDNLVIKVMVDANLTIPQFGFAGYNPGPNEIEIYISDSFEGLTASLERELPAILAHEMHHAQRQRTIGYGNTLFQAIISEGLADHFSVEAIGSNPPPWSTAVSGDRLQELTAIASQEWNNSPYDFEKWFFGTTSEIPVWTGYSIGYDLVGNYLTQNPSFKASTLYDEPAASFTP